MVLHNSLTCLTSFVHCDRFRNNVGVATMISLRQCIVALASAGTALAASSYATLEVRNAGVPAGQMKSIRGSMCATPHTRDVL